MGQAFEHATIWSGVAEIFFGKMLYYRPILTADKLYNPGLSKICFIGSIYIFPEFPTR